MSVPATTDGVSHNRLAMKGGYMGMDSERAQEIFDSLGVIEVLHRGAPVWIEAVANDQARIKYLDSQERTRVPVAELVENETGAQWL